MTPIEELEVRLAALEDALDEEARGLAGDPAGLAMLMARHAADRARAVEDFLSRVEEVRSPARADEVVLLQPHERGEQG